MMVELVISALAVGLVGSGIATAVLSRRDISGGPAAGRRTGEVSRARGSGGAERDGPGRER